ncbi:hypothetical protein BD413DRAFT_610710 [Trametes elegans]|nr:hypothetical protein BD413DRAFT_610710 [Trametes elegans]
MSPTVFVCNSMGLSPDGGTSSAVSYGPVKPLPNVHIPRNAGQPVVLMRYGDIPRGADTVDKSFVNDSMVRYFGAADAAPFQEARLKLHHFLVFIEGIRQKTMLAVSRGEAIMRYLAPGSERPSLWFRGLLYLVNIFDTVELDKRKREFREKAQAIALDAFGPEKLAGSLITALTDKADAEGRDVWLITVEARSFYESLSFSEVRTCTIGDGNPQWDGEPIKLHLMHRAAGKSNTFTTEQRP